MVAPSYPLTTHYSALPALGYNEMLFTHSGLSYVLTSSLYLDLAASSFSIYKNSRYIALNYNYDEDRSVAIRYLPYTEQIKLRNPVRVTSKAKLRSTITRRRYEVTFAMDSALWQTRKTYYQAPADYKLSPRGFANYSLYTEANNGDLISTVELPEPPGQVIRSGYTERTEDTEPQASYQRVIGHLPYRKGYIFEVGSELIDNDSVETFNNQRVSASKIKLSGWKDGCIPASRVGHDMNSKSPADTAWALMYAIGTGRTLLVLDTLKGLVHEGQLRNIVIWDENDREYQVNPEAAWGFEPKFIPGATSIDTTRDIGDNALLGWAVCSAIRYLQQRLPLDDWSLTGSYTEFKDLLSQFLLSVGYLCAYAVSRETWWACDKAEGLAYNYGVLSQRASYLSSIFFNDLLQIVYDPFIHQQAARLQVSLTSIEGALQGRHLVLFTDVSNSVTVGYRAFWLWATQKQPQQAYQTIIDYYEDEGESSINSIAAYLMSVIHEELDIEDPLPAWVLAVKGDNQEAALGRHLPVGKTTSDFLPIYLAIKKISLVNPDYFELHAEGSLGQVVWTLTELRRFWPNGTRWGSSVAINTVNSLLGAMFKADANLYFDYFVMKSLVVTARSPHSSQATYLRDWVKDLVGMEVENILAGDEFLRSLVTGYVNRNPNDRESIEELFRVTLGYTECVVSKPQPNPYSLIKNTARAADTFTDYHPEVTELGDVDYINQQRSHSVVYRPAQEQLISEDVTDTSSINRITAYGGRLLRRVAGFPYRNVPISGSYPNASAEVPINQEYSDTPTITRLMYEPWTDLSNKDLNASYEEWANEDRYELEGSAMIKPLHLFIPRLIINLGRVADRFLGSILLATIAAGVKLKVVAPSNRDDELNTFWVFEAANRRWRVSNIDLFNNLDYDNDSY
jgi:hypothetical protein